jgi:hypothetical protein
MHMSVEWSQLVAVLELKCVHMVVCAVGWFAKTRVHVKTRVCFKTLVRFKTRVRLKKTA